MYKVVFKVGTIKEKDRDLYNQLVKYLDYLLDNIQVIYTSKYGSVDDEDAKFKSPGDAWEHDGPNYRYAKKNEIELRYVDIDKRFDSIYDQICREFGHVEPDDVDSFNLILYPAVWTEEVYDTDTQGIEEIVYTISYNDSFDYITIIIKY